MRTFFVLIAIALGAIAWVNAPAQSALVHLMAAAAIDPSAAARQAAASTGGRVLNVQTSSSGGRVVYVVKVLLNDGRVKLVHVDGSGR